MRLVGSSIDNAGKPVGTIIGGFTGRPGPKGDPGGKGDKGDDGEIIVSDSALHVLVWEGNTTTWVGAWPETPDDDLPVFYIGGKAPGNDPPDQKYGDLWIPQVGDRQDLGSTLDALRLLAATANRIPYFSADGVAALLTFSTNGALGTSDTTLVSQKAIKAAIDAAVSAIITNGSFSTPTLNNPTITNYTESVVDLASVGSAAAKTLSLATGTVFKTTLTANCVFTMPPATDGKSFMVRVYTGAGSFTPTFTGVKWPGSVTPTWTATGSRLDIVTFVADGTSWYGAIAPNYTP